MFRFFFSSFEFSPFFSVFVSGGVGRGTILAFWM